jgi:hypothetical protein
LSTNPVPRFYYLFDFRNTCTKLEHFNKLQGNLKFHQNKCHPVNVPDMRRQGAKATDQSAQGGPADQTPWPASPTLLPLAGRLHGDTLQEAVTRIPKLKVGGGQTPWLPGHVAGPTTHHLASYRLKNNPYRWKSTHHTLLVVLHL